MRKCHCLQRTSSHFLFIVFTLVTIMKKYSFLIIAGMLLAFAFVPSCMKAQCPTNIIPDSVGWTVDTLNGHVRWIAYTLPTGCILYFDYCKRTVQLIDTTYDTLHVAPFTITAHAQRMNVNEYAVDTVMADTSCNSHYNPQDLIGWAVVVMHDSVLFNPCSASPADTAWGRGYKANCWKLQVWNPTLYAYLPCGDGSSHCVFQCPPCGPPVDCVRYTEGTISCSSPPATWVAGTCYNTGCNAPPGPH